MGVFDLLGTTASGWLSDRMDNRWLLCWYYSLRGLSLLFLPYAYGTGFFVDPEQKLIAMQLIQMPSPQGAPYRRTFRTLTYQALTGS